MNVDDTGAVYCVDVRCYCAGAVLGKRRVPCTDSSSSGGNSTCGAKNRSTPYEVFTEAYILFIVGAIYFFRTRRRTYHSVIVDWAGFVYRRPASEIKRVNGRQSLPSSVHDARRLIAEVVDARYALRYIRFKPKNKPCTGQSVPI